MPDGEMVTVSSGAIPDGVNFYSEVSRSNTSRTSASIDPIGALLAVRSVRISIDAMQSQYFQSSFFSSLA